jgi:zinc/manganese transport system permease protein
VSDWWSALFDFRDYGALLALLHNSVLAGAVLGIAGGLIGVFVMTRDLAFAVHGVSELSFAGAAAAMRVTAGPIAVPLLSALFGFVSAVGGILLAIMGTLPVSPYITTISFLIYVVCRVVGARRDRVTRVAA